MLFYEDPNTYKAKVPKQHKWRKGSKWSLYVLQFLLYWGINKSDIIIQGQLIKYS